MDTSTICRTVHKVCRAITSLNSEFMKTPVTDDEAQMNSNSSGFYNTAGVPRCILAIDFTHIKISSRGRNQP
nr:unnamed protein product [Callosobruchus analis]